MVNSGYENMPLASDLPTSSMSPGLTKLAGGFFI